MVFKVYAKWIDRTDKGAEAAKANAVIGEQLSPNVPRGTGRLNDWEKVAETESAEIELIASHRVAWSAQGPAFP